jgi:outer membrane lipoprotein SlyB
MKKTIAILTALAVVGCASYVPVIDTKGVDMNRYHVDLNECQQYAAQESPGQSAAIGAVAGAILGAVISRAAGSRYDAHAAARVGAVTGAAGGAAHGAESQMDIIRNCLRGRGYSVLR